MRTALVFLQSRDTTAARLHLYLSNYALWWLTARSDGERQMYPPEISPDCFLLATVSTLAWIPSWRILYQLSFLSFRAIGRVRIRRYFGSTACDSSIGVTLLPQLHNITRTVMYQYYRDNDLGSICQSALVPYSHAVPPNSDCYLRSYRSVYPQPLSVVVSQLPQGQWYYLRLHGRSYFNGMAPCW